MAGKANHTAVTNSDETAKLNESKDTEDGEIFSDDEEAAYYPQHVRSRPHSMEKKVKTDAKQSDCESQKSDSEPLSGVRSGRSSRDRRERERNLRSSPESESDSTYQSRSDTKERGLFFEDRDGSESESVGSRDRTRSRSREREKDHHSSPKYGGRHGNRNRERDRSNRSRNDDDSSEDRDHHHSSYYSRQSGGYGRTRGGYGGYQQRGGYGSSKFQSGGGGHGGYSSSVQPGLMNTGMTAQQFHTLASKVKKRREDGLPLLPQPNLDKCGNLDQYNYPAPPSWYAEEVEAWEMREKEAEERAKEEANGKEDTEEVVEKAKESEPEKEEHKRPISPLFRRTSSVALEIVSSPVSDEESPMEISKDNNDETDKDPVPSSENSGLSHVGLPETNTEPMETVPSMASGPDTGSTATVKPLKELAAIVLNANNKTESTSPTVATAITTTTTTTTTTPTQSLLDLPTSTAEPSQPTSNSLQEKPPTKPPPTVPPLTITDESAVPESDSHSRSPSLSPTIPIQSGSLTKGASSLPPKTTFRPKIMSDSDSEGDYDDYLDQLDQEEDDVVTKDSTSLLTNTLSEGFPLLSDSVAPSLTSLFEAGDKAEASNQILSSIGDPLSEDFPTIGGQTDKASSNQLSLMSLLGQDAVSKDSDDKKAPGQQIDN